MKRAAALVIGLMFMIAAAGCAPAERHSYQKVKCPACGYEFDAPRE